MPCKITNEETTAVSLPYPLKGVLDGGKSIVIDETVARVTAWMPEQGATGGFKLSDIDTTGPFDTGYGPLSAGAGEPGISPVHNVALATAAAMAANTYSATNKTITLDATGTLTVDGVVTALNDRILVKNESAAKNGIYKVTTAGAVGVAAVLTRDFDWFKSADVQAGMLVAVQKGTANTALVFVVNFTGAFTLDTTVPTFDTTRFAPAGTALTDTATQTIQRSQGDWRNLPVLGQNGVLTLGVTGALAGQQIDISRSDVSAFTYAIVNGGGGGGETLCTFPVSKIASAKLQFDGTDWKLRQIGQLA